MRFLIGIVIAVGLMLPISAYACEDCGSKVEPAVLRVVHAPRVIFVRGARVALVHIPRLGVASRVSNRVSSRVANRQSRRVGRRSSRQTLRVNRVLGRRVFLHANCCI